jgi:2-haloacid dehalogenase
MLGGEITETVDILRRIKETGIPTYALTNWSRETFPVAREMYEFLSWFDGILVSGEEGVRKPSPAIFELFLERFGLESENTFFVDDIEANVKTARSLGFQAFLYETPQKLEQDLKNLDIL